MSDVLTRSYEIDDGHVSRDGRTLRLALVPFDVPAWVKDPSSPRPYREGFRRGAFAHLLAAANRVELRYEHDQSGLPYGFGSELVEDDHRLVGTFRAAKSDTGAHLLALVEDGLRGVSVGFMPDKRGDKRDGDGILWRSRVKLLKEVSLTTQPLYSGAELLEVRAAQEALDVAAARERARWDLAKLRGVR